MRLFWRHLYPKGRGTNCCSNVDMIPCPRNSHQNISVFKFSVKQPFARETCVAAVSRVWFTNVHIHICIHTIDRFLL